MIDIKSIWANQLPTGDLIVKTKIYQIKHFTCFAATNHITGNLMFIFKISSHVETLNLSKLKFRGVKIEIFDYKDYKEMVIYLLDNTLKDIFSYFIEDVLNAINISTTEIEALNNSSNIIIKWKSLFDKVSFNGLSIEQQKGLMGELYFIIQLLDHDFPIFKIFENWTGVEFENKDFLFGSTGIEIKFTSAKVPGIKISSERQLDSQNLTSLYVILYIAEEVKEKGESLNTLIETIKNRIDTNQAALQKFNELLFLVGYREEDIEHYEKRYAIKKINYYNVGKSFPKIVPNNLQLGIYNTTYHIEISACEENQIDEEFIFKKIMNG